MSNRIQTDLHLIVVGIVVGFWKLDGHIKIKPLTSNPNRFDVGNYIIVDNEKFEIRNLVSRKDLIFVKFANISKRSEVELFKGLSVYVDIEQTNKLPHGTYYYFQLIGLEVWTVEKKYLGNIVEILKSPANDVYLVRNELGAETLIPAVKGSVLEVNIKSKKMLVDYV